MTGNQINDPQPYFFRIHWGTMEEWDSTGLVRWSQLDSC
jgi:hypothetical protein